MPFSTIRKHAPMCGLSGWLVGMTIHHPQRRMYHSSVLGSCVKGDEGLATYVSFLVPIFQVVCYEVMNERTAKPTSFATVWVRCHATFNWTSHSQLNPAAT